MVCSVQQTRSMIFAEICARIPYPMATGELCAISLWRARESFFFLSSSRFLFCLFSGTHFLSSWPSVEVRAGAFCSDAACHARGYGSKSVGRCRITVRGFPRFATASETAGFSLANCAFLSPLTPSCRWCEQIAQVAANSVDDVRSERTKKTKTKEEMHSELAFATIPAGNPPPIAAHRRCVAVAPTG